MVYPLAHGPTSGIQQRRQPAYINSSRKDLLLDDRLENDATTAHAYADLDWAACTKMRRSFGGSIMRLAGGTIAYKSKFQPTVAGSSTEAEFMAAYYTGKMILFVRSVLWDLGVPQEAATVLYEDNDACTAKGNAQKSTIRTRHIDIKTFSLCEWVLMHLERIDTTITWPTTSQRPSNVPCFIGTPTFF
jgi:hypothetical protein